MQGGQVLSHGLRVCFMIQVGLLWQLLRNVRYGVRINEHNVMVHFFEGWFGLNSVYKTWRKSEEQVEYVILECGDFHNFGEMDVLDGV